jgi:hypothetical protein
MKTTLKAMLALAACVMLVAVAPASEAKDLKGRLGIGLEQSLGGVSGFTVRYWPAQAFGLSVTVGAQLISFTEVATAEDKLASTIKTSFGFTYNMSRSNFANLGIGARLAIGFRSEAASQLDNLADEVAALQFSLEIPLTVEFFFSDNFSLSVGMGFVLAFIPEEGAVLDDGATAADGAKASLVVNFGGSATANIGLVYYF